LKQANFPPKSEFPPGIKNNTMKVEESKRNTLNRDESQGAHSITGRNESRRYSTVGGARMTAHRYSIVGAKQIITRRATITKEIDIPTINNNFKNQDNNAYYNDLETPTEDPTQDTTTHVTRKYDIYLYTALIINLFLLIIIIMDIYQFTQIRTKQPVEPDPVGATAEEASHNSSIQNSIDNITSVIEELNIKMSQVPETMLRSPPVRRYIFLIQYIANYTSLLCFIFNILHHPYHRRVRSKALMFSSILIFIVRVVWESFVEKYTPLIVHSYCQECEEDYDEY